jgi:hypothetical protein
MRGMKPSVDRRGRVEGRNGVHHRVLSWRKHERLAERLEPPLGPIHADHNSRKDTHPAELIALLQARLPFGAMGRAAEQPGRGRRAAEGHSAQ